MFFTRQYDYALRVVRALSEGKLLSVNEICAAEYIAQPFAYKILKKLEKASFVVSRRGANGGYQLIKDPRDILLYDIYVAIEGEIYINECLQDGYICPNRATCMLHNEMYKLQEEFIGRLKERSIYTILEMDQHHEK